MISICSWHLHFLDSNSLRRDWRLSEEASSRLITVIKHYGRTDTFGALHHNQVALLATSTLPLLILLLLLLAWIHTVNGRLFVSFKVFAQWKVLSKKRIFSIHLLAFRLVFSTLKRFAKVLMKSHLRLLFLRHLATRW